jgi:peptide/nickel transport system permease protein
LGGYVAYLTQRLAMLVATVLISVSVVFVVPRLVPGDPLGALFITMSSIGGGGTSGAAIVQKYRERFGLDKPLWQQYFSFLGELLRRNLGYSIASFRSRVSDILWFAIPWTIGLLLVTTLMSWTLGTLIGALVGWRGGRSPAVPALVTVALLTYTTPYYILAIILLFLFAFYRPIFPLAGAYSVGARPELTVRFALDVLHHAALPAASIVLVSLGWWFLSMRSLITAASSSAG